MLNYPLSVPQNDKQMVWLLDIHDKKKVLTNKGTERENWKIEQVTQE